MGDMDFDELLMRIVKSSGMSKEDVLARINAKVTELSGLVSKKGAAHIVASSFGIQLNEARQSAFVELKNLVAGLNNISISAVITRVFPINEFDKNGKTGKVASVIINDGTDEARLVFWNEMTEIIASGKLNVNDFIKVHHLRSKKGNYGFELHFGARSRIDVNPEGDKPKIVSVNNKRSAPNRFLICDLQQGLETELRACLVKLHDFKVFYDVCPDCGKSAKDNKCADHGEVKPKKALIISSVFDDGTGSIRCIFFKQQAETLLGCSTDYAVKLALDNGSDAAIINEKRALVGEEFVISGRVNHNSFNDQLEMVINSIVKADPLVEAKKLMAQTQ
ncbi:MAG: DUF2240 family protein [Candidatus Nanoarchaeia archaeon]|jgi:ssDNA-binding replication factor A large subunit